MAISTEVSSLYDKYHLDNLYQVSRFCYNRLTSKALPSKFLRQPPSQLVSNRAQKYYQVNFASEVGNLQNPRLSAAFVGLVN